MATRWLRILSLSGNDKIANPIFDVYDIQLIVYNTGLAIVNVYGVQLIIYNIGLEIFNVYDIQLIVYNIG